MHRREFITAAVGTAAAVASASQAIAEDYPDFGAIKKVPAGEGQAGAASKGIEGEAGAPKKGIIEKITEAIGGSEMEQMHPPKYNALEKISIECVATGNDCLRHCLGMFAKRRDRHDPPRHTDRASHRPPAAICDKNLAPEKARASC
jgi:hypothetical protein